MDSITSEQVKKLIEVNILWIINCIDSHYFFKWRDYTTLYYNMIDEVCFKFIVCFRLFLTYFYISSLLQMVEGNEKSTFSLAQFSAIAAFSERLLFSETQ